MRRQYCRTRTRNFQDPPHPVAIFHLSLLVTCLLGGLSEYVKSPSCAAKFLAPPIVHVPSIGNCLLNGKSSSVIIDINARYQQLFFAQIKIIIYLNKISPSVKL